MTANGDEVNLEIRPPLQRRTREGWERVLDAGVELLEEGGYEAFTIAALCERAEVAPRAVYARADNKDALFLAVYEHGRARITADEAVFADDARWARLAPVDVAREAVAELARMFDRHAAFLRAVILISAAHPEVKARGSRNAHLLGARFGARVLTARDAIVQPDPEAAVRMAFEALFATLVLRVAYGREFSTDAPGDVAALVTGYLFGADATR